MPSELDRFWTSLAPRYRLERELRRGGMATVYLVQDLRHARPVALKLMNLELVPPVAPGGRGGRSSRRKSPVPTHADHLRDVV